MDKMNRTKKERGTSFSEATAALEKNTHPIRNESPSTIQVNGKTLKF